MQMQDHSNLCYAFGVDTYHIMLSDEFAGDLPLPRLEIQLDMYGPVSVLLDLCACHIESRHLMDQMH
jgi:hypothetical protein